MAAAAAEEQKEVPALNSKQEIPDLLPSEGMRQTHIKKAALRTISHASWMGVELVNYKIGWLVCPIKKVVPVPLTAHMRAAM